MRCPVCAGGTEHFGDTVVLRRHHASFRRCVSCGFLCAEDPSWLEEAYASALTASDIGLVQRNLWFAKVAAAVVAALFDSSGRFIDYGGGTGLFTRLMRDAGFDWYWYDRSCANVFAKGYEADLGAGGYQLMTAAELFEHLVDPLRTLAELNRLAPAILLTTQLLPDPAPRLDQWWYYGLEHGQHVSFYTGKSLQVLGEQLDLRCTSNGRNLHLLSGKGCSDGLFKVITSDWCSALLRVARRRSLLAADFAKAKAAGVRP